MTQADRARGIITPFRRDAKNDFANATGVELIASNVRQILGTVGATEAQPGELRWDDEIGSQFKLIRHRKNDPTLTEVVRVYAIRALQVQEPRARVRGASQAIRGRKRYVDIAFDVIDAAGNVLLANQTAPVFIAAEKE